MEYARLETATLAHVDDSYYYGAYCRKCKHSARLSMSKLRAHLGDTFPLRKLKDKLRCERCSSRQIVITFLATDQRTRNLVELFNRAWRVAAFRLKPMGIPRQGSRLFVSRIRSYRLDLAWPHRATQT
jgi:hypothetical protein